MKKHTALSDLERGNYPFHLRHNVNAKDAAVKHYIQVIKINCTYRCALDPHDGAVLLQSDVYYHLS